MVLSATPSVRLSATIACRTRITSPKHMADARPFKILGVRHIAIGGPDLERLRHLWGGILGLSLGDAFTLTSENVKGSIARLGGGAHAVEVDLLQPLDADKKPAPHLPPLNHVAFWVDCLPEAVE